MSQAFVKESEEQWLHEIPPTLQALKIYLTRENNGVRVYDKKSYSDPTTNGIHYTMSNGLTYAIDKEGKWYVAG
ncbi:MAG TPA: hypothetical protein PL009_05595 [Flavipsychrobacter sp.]|nr:hypothetical protein [Flavipsychrobacter sp.]